MKPKYAVGSFLLLFGILCLLPLDSGLISCRRCSAGGSSSDSAAEEAASVISESSVPPEASSTLADETIFSRLSAVSGREQTAVLGQLYEDCRRFSDPERYKFQIELTSRGAAVQRVTLSEFNDRDPNHPEPFVLLDTILASAKEIASFSCNQLRLDRDGMSSSENPFVYNIDTLNWELTERSRDAAVFEVLLGQVEILDGKAVLTRPQIRLRKTYRIQPGSYDLRCELTAENLMDQPIETGFQIQGAGAMIREDTRTDERKLLAAYRTDKGSVESRALLYTQIRQIQKNLRYPSQSAWSNFKKLFGMGPGSPEKLKLKYDKNGSRFLWSASVNKYFAAIVRPLEEGGVSFGQADYYDKNLQKEKPSEGSAGSFVLQVEPLRLSAAHAGDSRKAIAFEIFLGPVEDQVFRSNPAYTENDYYQTMDIQGCCCPASMIRPLAFGIIWLMNALYGLMGPWGNYGIVIMILVFLVRLILHPVTKKSQVTMMKVQKLGPKMQEVQKKYAGNPQELRKRIAEVYDQAGLSQLAPVMGMLPMLLQMPIWIALWTAVNSSIDLRGAGFLPVWITDLSIPDRLFVIPFASVLQQIPFLGAVVPDYCNLLPILMGAVFFMQQKLMPQTQPSAEARPEIAQQQKIMMIMFPLLFPLMLYNGPSGVNLYIMSSIGAGVIEQYVVRRHIQQEEQDKQKGLVPATSKTGGKVKKKKPKPLFREYR